MATGMNIALHRVRVMKDCKSRLTKRTARAKLSRKQSANVMEDCKNNPTRRGFWEWLLS